MRSEVIRRSTSGGDLSRRNGHSNGQYDNGTSNGHHSDGSSSGRGSALRQIALVELDPTDTNIKVVIRDGHIIAGEDTLPYKNFKKSQTDLNRPNNDRSLLGRYFFRGKINTNVENSRINLCPFGLNVNFYSNFYEAA